MTAFCLNLQIVHESDIDEDKTLRSHVLCPSKRFYRATPC